MGSRSVSWHPVILGYLILINLAGFILMGADKRRAKRDQWRIRERTFFFMALLGGSLGTILGMKGFHHKTRHWYFRFGLPAILAAQGALTLFLFLRGRG